MIEIQIPENEVGIRVFTEEVPDLKELPVDVETILIGILPTALCNTCKSTRQ